MFSKLKKIYRQHREKEVVLLYQMGKVGSMSILKSLHDIDVEVLHTHTFFGNFPVQIFSKYKEKKLFLGGFLYETGARLYKNIRLKLLLGKNGEKRLKIITILREPISRNISLYFQDFQIPLAHHYINDLPKHRTISEKNSIDVFIADYFENFNHFHGINWFDDEFKRVLGIDVFDYDFDKVKGYGIIERDNIDILILQMEKINQLENVIGQFVGNDNFRLANENTSHQKWYAPVYRDFKRKIKFDQKYVDDMYNSKFMRHFYSDDDIESFKKALNYV